MTKKRRGHTQPPRKKTTSHLDKQDKEQQEREERERQEYWTLPAFERRRQWKIVCEDLERLKREGAKGDD